MNYKQFTEFVKERHNGSNVFQGSLNNAISLVLESLVEALKKEDNVTLGRLGRFIVKERKGRIGVNPKTKEKIEIPPKTTVKFKASSSFENAVSREKKA